MFTKDVQYHNSALGCNIPAVFSVIKLLFEDIAMFRKNQATSRAMGLGWLILLCAALVVGAAELFSGQCSD